jgi:hypothetical protein
MGDNEIVREPADFYMAENVNLSRRLANQNYLEGVQK